MTTLKTVLLIFSLSLLGSASTVQFVSAGPDQPYGPYTLVVDGKTVQAVCFNYFAGVDSSWTATAEPLISSGLPNTTMDEIYWLSQQFATQSQGNWWAIHESIWDLGATIYGSPGGTQPFSGWEVSYWLSQAGSLYFADAGDNITVLLPQSNKIQPFIYGSPDPPRQSATPEPGSIVLVAIGAGALFIGKRRAHA